MGKGRSWKAERKTAAAADRHRKGAVRVAGTGGGLRRRLLVLAEPASPDTFYYRNMEMTALDGVEHNTYIPQAFVRGENGWISYPDALQGVDVSVYQGEIDCRRWLTPGWTLPSSGGLPGLLPGSDSA